MVTTVHFTLSVPVRKLATEESKELDELLTNWRDQKEITQVQTTWLAVPKKKREGMSALVELSVRLRARSHADLRELYRRLSNEANTAPISLSGRSCVLTDLYE